MHTHYQLAMLWSDWIVWALFAAGIALFFWMRRYPHLRKPWGQVVRRKLGMIAFVFLLFYVATGLLDSVHLQATQKNQAGQVLSIKTKSLLDLIVAPLGDNQERTYSAPFSSHLYSKSLVTLPNGKEVRAFSPLQFSGTGSISKKITLGLTEGLLTLALLSFLLLWVLAKKYRITFLQCAKRCLQGKTGIAWREALITFGLIGILIFVAFNLATSTHIFGTDKVGKDVFYESIKSIRTGLLIGTLTTLFMLPFALILGTMAGYFRGIVDDIIQYLYTTLSSIPSVLLITASILVLQVYIANHPNLFPTLIERADARLLALCFILGITSWASLCRLLRGETLKLRNLEFIHASRALGVHRIKIIFRHIMPNVMHIVLITLVLDFSGLVLAEAVLSYVGVGVDPTTISWGNMINSSRLELAREPIVWWPLLAALVFMFVFVLAANLFADVVRDAFDPRINESH